MKKTIVETHKNEKISSTTETKEEEKKIVTKVCSLFFLISKASKVRNLSLRKQEKKEEILKEKVCHEYSPFIYLHTFNFLKKIQKNDENQETTTKKVSPLKRSATENLQEESETSPPKKQKIDHPVVDKILENDNASNVPVPTHEEITKTLEKTETTTKDVAPTENKEVVTA